jgi:hypothetical protein
MFWRLFYEKCRGLGKVFGFLGMFWVVEFFRLKKEKKLYINVKDGNPSIKSTRQKRTQVDTTQRNNKSKQSTKIK